MTQITASEDRRAWLEDRSRRMGYRAGHVFFSTCPTCGASDWACTQINDNATGEPITELVVAEQVALSSERCGLCASVAQRSPEVYQWVTAVLSWQVIQQSIAAEEGKS